VLGFSAGAGLGKPWRGIVPLHSTRADVERLLGRPSIEDWGYEIDDAVVAITYSARGCEEGLAGWNVSPNTVEEIRVAVNDELFLSEVQVRGKTLEQIYTVRTAQIEYLDVEEGVRYSTVDGLVRAITYLGSAEDLKKFACGQPKYAASLPEGAKLNRFQQYPFDSYGRMPFELSKPKLNYFANYLQELNKERSNYRGFILVYAGRSAHIDEAKKVAECVRNYLLTVGPVNPDTIITLDAGYRDDFKVELYITPNDAYPPMLQPTISPQKIEILPGEFNPCRAGDAESDQEPP